MDIGTVRNHSGRFVLQSIGVKPPANHTHTHRLTFTCHFTCFIAKLCRLTFSNWDHTDDLYASNSLCQTRAPAAHTGTGSDRLGDRGYRHAEGSGRASEGNQAPSRLRPPTQSHLLAQRA